ncbi:hypothetical protein GCM10023257_11570 [Streptomyces hyderabadensis]|uniref:Uncharacterized protein n=1 Tax=Streptomyces hyderabadensis TaxID=598549 RepID=A0ABP9HRA5_9ACTN
MGNRDTPHRRKSSLPPIKETRSSYIQLESVRSSARTKFTHFRDPAQLGRGPQQPSCREADGGGVHMEADDRLGRDPAELRRDQRESGAEPLLVNKAPLGCGEQT